MVLKAGIFMLVAWYIYRLLTEKRALSDFNELIVNVSPSVIISSLTVVLLLMLINWFTESLKWQYICLQFQPITLAKAIESVLCGLAWAVFTPNRIGEYGGRVLFLMPRKRVYGIIGMTVGAISLMVITNVLGALAICWFVASYLELKGIWMVGLVVLAFVYASFFLVLYFNIGVINKLLLKIKFLKKFERFFSLLLRYKKKELRRVFGYSLIRYVVFTSQYCLLLQVFIAELPFLEMVLMIFILFFVQSALPSLDLFDIGVRGVTANYFFGFLTNQQIAVMAIVGCIWLINLIIPAVIGSVFTFKINFFGPNHS